MDNVQVTVTPEKLLEFGYINQADYELLYVLAAKEAQSKLAQARAEINNDQFNKQPDMEPDVILR